MKRLLFIAIVYNTVEETRDLCLSLAQQDPGDYERALVLVDNSDTETARAGVDALAAEFAFVEVLRPERNLGYFPAISLALGRHAKGTDYVIAGNNDLVYADDFCATLLAQSYDDDIMVICPDVVTADGAHQNPHHKYRVSRLEKLYFDVVYTHYICARLIVRAKRLLTSLGAFKHHSTLGKRGEQRAQEIDKGVGAIYVFTPDFLEKIAFQLYFPGFLYGEEACLAWQVRKAGGRTWYDPSLNVWHAESATLGTIPKRTTYELARSSYWKIRHTF